MWQVDEAIKRLHVNDINLRTSVLPPVITASEGAMKLVKHLGFHFQVKPVCFKLNAVHHIKVIGLFQARGVDLTEPYVIFPHWNHEELLIPTYEALSTLEGF